MYFFRTALLLVAATLAAAQDFGFAGVSNGLLRGNGFGNDYGYGYRSGYGSGYGNGYRSGYGSGYGSDYGFGGSSSYAVVPVVQSAGVNYAQNDAGFDAQRVNVVRTYAVNEGNGYGNAVRRLRNNAVSTAPAVFLAPAVNTVSYNDFVDTVDRDAFRGYNSAAAAVPVFDNEFSGNRLVTYASPAVSTFGNDDAYEVESFPVTTKVVRTTTVVSEGIEDNTDANVFQNGNVQAARVAAVPTVVSAAPVVRTVVSAAPVVPTVVSAAPVVPNVASASSVVPVATTGYRTSGFGGRFSNGASRNFVTSSNQYGSLLY